ncbi:PREDICTED: putative ferric-chelate reductase 1 [Cyprinodon variegatus]|uniref:putative ferric-chelate reductase 1 n=1 Tax=Cyprinodon variegatus TaxID=28743 RepID=UPI0007428083|nr:PREDICTED: putative ferric-chelate reductase 1 [Cyprinodon variegatus]
MKLFLLLSAVPVVWCFSSGLVSDSCVDMSPHHVGSPQTTASPFTVSVEQSGFRPGEDVTGHAGSKHDGYHVGGAADRCTKVAPGATKAAVSHTSDSAKTNIQVKWKPDSVGSIEAVQFHASFVESYKTFWVDVKSPVLSLINDNSTSTPGYNTITSAGCGDSKVCFSRPAGCDPATGSLCYFMSAQVLPGGSAVRYEMTGTADGYVAFGFSDDQMMGNDDIYICGIDRTGLMGVQRAFSTGRTAPQVQPLGNVSDVTASSQNGVLSCSFTSRNPISTQRSSGYSSLFYLLFAYGNSRNGIIQMHQDTFTSKQRLQISSPAVVQSDRNIYIIQTHGALMLIAWMTTGPLGMMLARFLKGAGEGVKLFGKDLWFVVSENQHQSVQKDFSSFLWDAVTLALNVIRCFWMHALMSVTVAATITAFVLAFVFVNGWAEGAHSVLGCLVLILALIQPTLALMRCGPQHRWRFLFNWGHSFIAASIHLLSVAAIFTGIQMMDGTTDRWLVKVMGGFAGWKALFYGLLELNRSWKLRTDGGSPPSGSNMVGVLLLMLYFLGNISFLVALLTGIGKMSFS